MPVLSPTLRLEPDESPMSHASRLARLHGRTIRQFCAELGLGFQRLLDGDAETLARLAFLSGVSCERLLHNAVRRIGDHFFDRSYEWRGQALRGGSLIRQKFRVCPRCLVQDMEEAGLRGHGPYGRATWLVEHVRTCPEHGVTLVTMPASPETLYDFAATLPGFERSLREGGVPIDAHPVSALERYVLDRLDGQSRPDAVWLDGLGLSAVADASERLGAVLAFGKAVSTRRLGGGEWRVAGDVGFAVMADGPAALREALSALDSSAPVTRADGVACNARYGCFQQFLSRSQERRPDLDPIRSVVSDHMMWTTSVGPGDFVLGKRITDRYVHSLRTAADQYGLSVALVMRLLREAGALRDGEHGPINEGALFDARANAALLEAATRVVRHGEVSTYLNASHAQTKSIIGLKLIPTLLDGTKPSCSWTHRYRLADLDEFLGRLLRGAHEVEPRNTGAITITAAASRVGCDPTVIVRFILDGRLPWVGRLAGVRGLRSIVVYPEDVATLLGDGGAAWHPSALICEFGLERDVVNKLIDRGVLPARTLSLRTDGRPVRLIDDEVVRTFRATYIWPSKRGGNGRDEVGVRRKELASRGIMPCLRKAEFGRDFYLRREVLDAKGVTPDGGLPTRCTSADVPRKADRGAETGGDPSHLIGRSSTPNIVPVGPPW